MTNGSETEQETLDEPARGLLLELSSCNACGGDGGCCDPDCWRCHSLLRSENLRTLAENPATAAALCGAWELRGVCPTRAPGCGKLPTGLMRADNERAMQRLLTKHQTIRTELGSLKKTYADSVSLRCQSLNDQCDLLEEILEIPLSYPRGTQEDR